LGKGIFGSPGKLKVGKFVGIPGLGIPGNGIEKLMDGILGKDILGKPGTDKIGKLTFFNPGFGIPGIGIEKLIDGILGKGILGKPGNDKAGKLQLIILYQLLALVLRLVVMSFQLVSLKQW
jgi:hypothetical protein